MRSEPQRRLRLYQKAQTYISLSHAGIPFFADDKPPLFRESYPKEQMTLQDIPCFYDSRTVGKKDEVSFVVTHIDEEQNVAAGLISRIIWQSL